MEYIFSSFLPYIVPQFYLPADMPRHNALIFFSALDEIVCNISSFVFSGSCMRSHVVRLKYGFDVKLEIVG